VFEPALLPPPKIDTELATLGLLMTICAALSCNSSIDGKAMSSEASMVAMICPMSSSGKKPFGL
jgi:hypothetical protein